MFPKKRLQASEMEVMSESQSEHLLKELCLRHEQVHPFLKDFGISRALHARDFRQLRKGVDSIESTVYNSAAEQFAGSQLAALVKKYPFPSFREDCKRAAIEKFFRSERYCKRYNKIFRLSETLKERDANARRIAERWIAYVIGIKPDHAAIASKCSFGPGASLGVHGRKTSLAHKFASDKWTVTPAALPYAKSYMCGDMHIWELLCKEQRPVFSWDYNIFQEKLDDRVVMVSYNKIALVPKTAWTDRSIAVEPLLNSYCQKGVDVFMRLCLKRVGIDLTDQTKNQFLAKIGSCGGSDPYVTIDLSAASDSISVGLVKRMLPRDWFNFLDAIRSPSFMLEGREYRYSKFVSMGNGFCFPLETLLFSAFAVAAYRELGLKPDFSVYGDDIIVRQSVSARVLQLLHNAGFRYNQDKTFLSGPFRESCGADWYSGRDVRPIYLKSSLTDVRALFSAYNLFKRKGLDHLATLVLNRIPSRWRLWRPYAGNPDSGLDGEIDQVMTSPHARYCSYEQRWKWRELRSSVISDRSLSHTRVYSTLQMLVAVRGGTSNAIAPMRRATSVKLVVV